jgi:hypothetical protein
VKLGIAIGCVAFALTGCMTARERQAQAIHNMDASDDAYCRKQANSPVNYDQGRKNLMQLRQAALAKNGDLGTSMKQAGASLQALSPPPAAPTVSTSTPWVGGGRTTCQ